MKPKCTHVLFRVWGKRPGSDREAFALFPFEPGTYQPHTCSSYAHVGQHSSADLAGCVRLSRQAALVELHPLLCELTRVGYERIRILKRTPRNAWSVRASQINSPVKHLL